MEKSNQPMTLLNERFEVSWPIFEVYALSNYFPLSGPPITGTNELEAQGLNLDAT